MKYSISITKSDIQKFLNKFRISSMDDFTNGFPHPFTKSQMILINLTDV